MEAGRDFVGRLRQHEEHAVQVLIDGYYAPIHRYLFRLVGDRETAEDLTQEAFLHAYRALPRLAEDSNLNAWLSAIATNLMVCAMLLFRSLFRR